MATVCIGKGCHVMVQNKPVQTYNCLHTHSTSLAPHIALELSVRIHKALPVSVTDSITYPPCQLFSLVLRLEKQAQWTLHVCHAGSGCCPATGPVLIT